MSKTVNFELILTFEAKPARSLLKSGSISDKSVVVKAFYDANGEICCQYDYFDKNNRLDFSSQSSRSKRAADFGDESPPSCLFFGKAVAPASAAHRRESGSLRTVRKTIMGGCANALTTRVTA
jgi:hypothetical protein